MSYSPQAVFQPGITQAGFEQLGQGIQQAGADFGRLKMQAKAADALYKAVQPEPDPITGAVEPNPIAPPDKWSTLGAQDKVAAMGGYIKKTALQSAMAEQQYRQAEAQKAQAAAQADSGDARLLGALDQQIQGGDTGSTDPNAPVLAASLTPIQRAVIHAGAQMGPTQRGSAAAIYRQLLPQIMGTGDDSAPTGVDVNGTRVIYKKGSKEFMVDPLQLSNTKTANAADLIHTKTDLAPDKTKLTDTDLLKSFDRQETALHGDLTLDPVVKATGLAKIDEARQEILNRNRQSAGGKDAGKTEPKVVTDKSGKKWAYKGSMADPTKDRDPANWSAQ